MIVVTVFLSILNQMEFHLVQNRKENCNHDHIPFNLKGNGNIVSPLQDTLPSRRDRIRSCRTMLLNEPLPLLAPPLPAAKSHIPYPKDSCFSASWGINWGSSWTIIALSYWGVWGRQLYWHPLYRETPDSQTAGVGFSSRAPLMIIPRNNAPCSGLEEIASAVRETGDSQRHRSPIKGLP